MNKEEKTGFIYIWYDKKRKMFYLGCHVGKEDDGYICSSRRMRDVYRRRPKDFKRRILKRDIPRDELLEEEHRWLDQIKDYELGTKYYNLSKHHFGHWANVQESRKTVGQKISESPDRRRKISEALKGKPSPFKGIPRSEKTKQKIRDNHSKPTLGIPLTDDHKKKIGQALKGRKLTPEQVAKGIKARTGLKRSEESRKRMSDAQRGSKKPWVKGRQYIKNPEETRRKMKAAALRREYLKKEKKTC